MRNSLLALFVFLAPLCAAATPQEEVRDTENAFANAFTARKQKEFASFIAPDATFIVNGKPAIGRDAILKAWADFLSAPMPPFSWKSEQVYVDDKGELAMSLGGVFDEQGKRIAVFTSFWRKHNGEWKVVFDGPGSPVRPAQPQP